MLPDQFASVTKFVTKNKKNLFPTKGLSCSFSSFPALSMGQQTIDGRPITPISTPAEQLKQSNVGKKPKLSTIQRRNEIIELLKIVPVQRVNQSELARKYGVNPKTINDDVHLIIEKWPAETLKEVFVDMSNALTHSMSTVRKHMDSKNEGISLQAAKAIPGMIIDTTEFLERFGKKQVIAHKVDVETTHKLPIADQVIDKVFTQYATAKQLINVTPKKTQDKTEE